jgi:hypothetical protein
MAELPAAAVKRLLVKHGGELRTSGPAVDLAVAAAEEYIARLAQEAGNAAQRGSADDRTTTSRRRQVVGSSALRASTRAARQVLDQPDPARLAVVQEAPEADPRARLRSRASWRAR